VREHCACLFKKILVNSLELLEHSIVESADVEFRSERFLRLFARTHDRERPGAPKRSKPSAALLMHRKPLTMDQIPLPEL
jgi:hypothetical protein